MITLFEILKFSILFHLNLKCTGIRWNLPLEIDFSAVEGKLAIIIKHNLLVTNYLTLLVTNKIIFILVSHEKKTLRYSELK